MSDIHIPEASDSLWPQVYDAFQDVDYIFHGGDIHELWLLDTLEQIAPVCAARGNAVNRAEMVVVWPLIGSHENLALKFLPEVTGGHWPRVESQEYYTNRKTKVQMISR